MPDNSLVVVMRQKLETEFFPDGVNIEQIRLLDRIEEMFGQAFSAGYKMAAMYDGGEWSNNACLGYVIAGAKRLKYSEEEIRKIVRSVYSEFDWKTIGEAMQIYEKSPY